MDKRRASRFFPRRRLNGRGDADVAAREVALAYIVETAEPADQVELSEVLDAAFAVYAPALGYRPSPMDRDYTPLLEQNFVLKLIDRRLDSVGFAVLLPQPGRLYLEAIAVAPEHQRAGGGSMLLDGFEQLAAELCLPTTRLHTPPALSGPMRFYERAGYRLVGRYGLGRSARALFEKRVLTNLEVALGRRI